MWQCSPTSRRCGEPAIRSIATRRLPQPEAELRIGLAGGDRGVGLARDIGGDPDQDVLDGAPTLCDQLQALDVVQRVEHDVTDPGVQRELELSDRFGVAVQIDAAGVKAATQRQRELAARRDVTGQTLLRQHPVDGGAGKRLGREQHVTVGVPRRRPPA